MLINMKPCPFCGGYVKIKQDKIIMGGCPKCRLRAFQSLCAAESTDTVGNTCVSKDEAFVGRVNHDIRPEEVKVDIVYTRAGGFSPISDSGIRVTHIPTGVSAESLDERSQHKNKQVAFEKLKELVKRVTTLTEECGGETGQAEPCSQGIKENAMLTDEFKREPRYIVLKIKDVLAHLSACQLDRLQEIGETVATGRSADGKPPLNVVVVEQDWPEFEQTWAAIEARMTGRAIEAEVLQAQEPVSNATLHAWVQSLSKGVDRCRQYADQGDAETIEDIIAYLTTPQPPAPCPKCARLQDELADALDVKNGAGPTALSMVMADRDALQVKVAKQNARIEQLNSIMLTDSTDAEKLLMQQVAQQAERIAQQDALIEKCEKALKRFRSDFGSCIGDEAIAAIAAQKAPGA